jgi:hypothetical protein
MQACAARRRIDGKALVVIIFIAMFVRSEGLVGLEDLSALVQQRAARGRGTRQRSSWVGLQDARPAPAGKGFGLADLQNSGGF